MNKKKYIIGISIIATVLVGVSSLVFAETTMMGQTGSAPVGMMQGGGDQQMVLQFGPKGGLMRGTIKSIDTGTNSIIVTGLGGDWIVTTTADTKFVPATNTNPLAVGQFVGVQGSIVPGALWTIAATFVRNWTGKTTVLENHMMLPGQSTGGDQSGENPKSMMGTQTNGNTQGILQQIQAIQEKIKAIEAQINARQSTTTTPAGQ